MMESFGSCLPCVDYFVFFGSQAAKPVFFCCCSVYFDYCMYVVGHHDKAV